MVLVMVVGEERSADRIDQCRNLSLSDATLLKVAIGEKRQSMRVSDISEVLGRLRKTWNTRTRQERMTRGVC